MYIDKIAIKRYRSIDPVGIEISCNKGLNIIIGENNSGKTAIIDALRIVDFQLYRCVGRLRPTHIYSDTINIVKEMLAEEGMQGKFDNILSQNDYFPESIFYQFLGSPENVFLYNEIFDEYIQKKN